MTTSYETMLYMAAMKMKEYNRHKEIADKYPDNEVARKLADHKATIACSYCDAIADMFDLGYETMYENARKAAEAL